VSQARAALEAEAAQAKLSLQATAGELANRWFARFAAGCRGSVERFDFANAFFHLFFLDCNSGIGYHRSIGCARRLAAQESGASSQPAASQVRQPSRCAKSEEEQNNAFRLEGPVVK